MALRSRRGRRRIAGLPVLVIVLAVLGAVMIMVPVFALASRTDWLRVPELISQEAPLAALLLSLRVAVATTIFSVAFGVPLAMLLARTDFPGKPVMRAVILLPMVMPPVVSGMALLTALGRRGVLGETLSGWGIEIAFTTVAVVVAHTFIAMPFLVLSVDGALSTAGIGSEVAAATLGASPLRTFFTITLPQTAPAIGAGALLSFARSLGEFGATLTFAGSLQGVTRTLPIEIYLTRQTNPDAAIALSMLLIAVALAVIVVVYSAGGTRYVRAATVPGRKGS